ncbi:efflux transporter outer membrane subunit [Herbaspirillum sp. SJZ099]|uniref:efflux transporter outer membrane subunit n=1 Tax=Herbaspirillum sp. SJZ099 TaxID=2572916 RepID=UPI00119E79E7|nr:efflux transporter outer membrane subunit [Herbaspirillum sp. SJZ099]TWC65811.1 NodT family efflux transporter outer membrane factor (OMF) lipoprotein [Herbaspirillum sp. SJZ099]
MRRLFHHHLPALTVIALALTIAGCADQGGIRPQAQVRDTATFDAGQAIGQAGAEAGWPQRAWWQAYNDPQLDALVQKAVAGNPSMAIAAARVRQAQSMAMVAHAGELPSAQLDAAIGRKDWSDNVYYGASFRDKLTWNNTATLGLTYNVDLWDRNKNATERAQDELHAVAADARAAQLDLESNVVRTYVQLALQYGLLDNTEAMLKEEQKILDLAHRRFTGGIGTQLEITQAESPLPETRRQIEALHESIALVRNQLAALLGEGPGAGDRIARPVLALHTAIGLPSALPAELVGRRPDISAARWRVEAAARGIAVAKAAFYPNLNLLAGIGPAAAGGGMLSFLSMKNWQTTYGPAISLPIFEGGRLRGQLGATTAGYDIEVEHYNALLSQALKSISDQVVTLQSVARQQQQAGESVAAAQKNVDIATRAYQRGLTDYLNVLQAQTQWLRQQQIVQQLQARHLAAYAALTAALGGGLEPAAAPGTETEAAAGIASSRTLKAAAK